MRWFPVWVLYALFPIPGLIFFALFPDKAP